MNKMIFQFSLYGFLKNLRFFEAFLLLFLKEKGLSFTQIGFLFAFKEVLVNVINIPTGAVADIYGRKKSLIFALSSYVISFLIFSYSNSFAMLYLAFFLFGIGESFRAGTHKAMIFDYLRMENRLKDKTLVYGETRSWSQRGSAVSVLIGAAIVYFGSGYKNIFLYSIIPYLAGVINIMLYPSYLDKKNETGSSLKEIFRHLIKTMKKCWQSIELRHLILQSTLYEGQYRSVKDYLQILIGTLAISLPFFLKEAPERKTAIFIAIIYFALYILSSYASKFSHKFLEFFNSEKAAIRTIMLITAVLLLISSVGVFINLTWISVLSFIFIFNLQNIMRPIMTAQYDNLSLSEEQATVLSVESQANSVGIFFLAPILGYLADHYSLAYAFLLCALVLLIYLSTTTSTAIFKRQTKDSPVL
ncbi:MAG: MFS transporter [Oligoflexia bacterium]|nr:MFS transporter [Oligoflexia bacterium]